MPSEGGKRQDRQGFLDQNERRIVETGNGDAGRIWMAQKTTKVRAWTKEDVRTLKTLAREKRKTSVIARTLKRSVGATYQKAHVLGVTLGTPRSKKSR